MIYRGELVASGTPEVLKTRFMQEDVLEVLCDEAEAAMGAIEKIPGVKEVALFGRGLHVVAEDGKRAAARLRSLMASSGRGPVRVEKIVPSLEDVFVSLIETRDRAEEALQEVRR